METIRVRTLGSCKFSFSKGFLRACGRGGSKVQYDRDGWSVCTPQVYAASYCCKKDAVTTVTSSLRPKPPSRGRTQSVQIRAEEKFTSGDNTMFSKGQPRFPGEAWNASSFLRREVAEGRRSHAESLMFLAAQPTCGTMWIAHFLKLDGTHGGVVNVHMGTVVLQRKKNEKRKAKEREKRNTPT